VVVALPRDDRGASLGAVFIQPLVTAEEAGVAFFDGFYWERTTAPGGNEGLTSGLDRGEVARGHLARDDPWSQWLTAVHRPFQTEAPRIDIEFARDARGWILLQVRPALFPVVRNETLSLANHKEILGDPPSPWIVSVLIDAGREVLSFFAAVDPEVGRWDEAYALELAERAWMNFSFFFRLMDHWGLPRSFITEGVGGEGGGSADRRLLFGRFVRKSPRLILLQVRNLAVIARIRREFSGLDDRIAAASGLADLHRACAEGLGLALRANFAINGALSGVDPDAPLSPRSRRGPGDHAGDDGGVQPSRRALRSSGARVGAGRLARPLRPPWTAGERSRPSSLRGAPRRFTERSRRDRRHRPSSDPLPRPFSSRILRPPLVPPRRDPGAFPG
jgi:hypothetical protein